MRRVYWTGIVGLLLLAGMGLFAVAAKAQRVEVPVLFKLIPVYEFVEGGTFTQDQIEGAELEWSGCTDSGAMRLVTEPVVRFGAKQLEASATLTPGSRCFHARLIVGGVTGEWGPVGMVSVPFPSTEPDPEPGRTPKAPQVVVVIVG